MHFPAASLWTFPSTLGLYVWVCSFPSGSQAMQAAGTTWRGLWSCCPVLLWAPVQIPAACLCLDLLPPAPLAFCTQFPYKYPSKLPLSHQLWPVCSQETCEADCLGSKPSFFCLPPARSRAVSCLSAARSGRKLLSAPLPHAPSHSPHTVSKPQAAAQRATASQTRFSRKKKFLFPCQQASLRFILHSGSSKCWFLHSALQQLHVCPLAQADTNPHVGWKQLHPLTQPATHLLSLSLSKISYSHQIYRL